MARIAVAATAPFGADVLEHLADRHDVAALITRPDRPQGRGRRPGPPRAKQTAERLDASLELPAGTIVVVAYGALIPDVLLDRALWLNVHPSLLPRWRGAAPVERAIMAGDEETGVTVHRTVEELDAGPWAAKEELWIGPDDTAGDIYVRAAPIAAALVEEAVENQDFFPQSEVGVTYAEKIRPADRELDWSRPAKELHDRIRALSPHIGARGELHGRRVIVWRSRLADGELEVLEVQPEGRRRMGYDEFLRGLR